MSLSEKDTYRLGSALAPTVKDALLNHREFRSTLEDLVPRIIEDEIFEGDIDDTLLEVISERVIECLTLEVVF